MGTFDSCANVISQAFLWIAGVILLCSMCVCAAPSQLQLSVSPDTQAIENRYIEFYSAIDQNDYESGYQYMSPAYRKTHTIDEFKSDFEFAGESWLRLHSDRSLKISGDQAKLYPLDRWEVWWSGPEYEMIKVDGEWYFTGEYIWHLD